MRVRIFTSLIVLVMLITCAACGTKEIDYTKNPVTITYLTIGEKPSNGRTEEVIKELNSILEKEVNARLDIYYIPWKDYLENYKLEEP